MGKLQKERKRERERENEEGRQLKWYSNSYILKLSKIDSPTFPIAGVCNNGAFGIISDADRREVEFRNGL